MDIFVKILLSITTPFCMASGLVLYYVKLADEADDESDTDNANELNTYQRVLGIALFIIYMGIPILSWFYDGILIRTAYNLLLTVLALLGLYYLLFKLGKKSHYSLSTKIYLATFWITLAINFIGCTYFIKI